MRMATITAILCIHMLLRVGCSAAHRLRELGSDEIVLRKSQTDKIFWRKLLEETTSKLDLNNAETTNASAETTSIGVGAKDAHTQNAEKGDVKEVNVMIDARIDMVGTDSASSIAQQGQVKNESVTLQTSRENDGAKEEENKSQQASKEEQTEIHVVEPIKVSDTNTTAMQKVEKTENSTTKAVAQNPTPITNEADAKVTEKGVETDENAQTTSLQNTKEEGSMQTEEKEVQIVLVNDTAPAVKIDGEEIKGQSDVETQGKVQGDVQEEVSGVAVVEEDKSDTAPEQMDATLGDVKTLSGDQQEALTEETGTAIKSNEPKEEPTEDNNIKAVEIDSGEKEPDLNGDAKIKLVQSSESEDDDKRQIAFDPPANIEEKGSSNSADNSIGEISKPSDVKADDVKIEKMNNLSNDNTEITEKNGEENNAVAVLQEKSDEKGEEKHELSNDNTELERKESENKDTEEVPSVKGEEKGEHHHELNENKDTEEVPQVKGEQKAEDNHESSEEKLVENHEPSKENTEVQDKEGESNDAEEVSQVKMDDEIQAAATEVESHLAALQRDTVLDTTNDRRQEHDPSDDEYDIIQELAELPTKFQETAGKVADHLRPDLLRWTDSSKEYFNLANQQISERFSPLIGRQYAPFFASMISYGVLLLPLLVVILLFEHIKALFSLQKVLLFINIYLAAYFATLWLASFIIGLEPMSFFYHNSLSSYLSLQLLQALGYVVYLILQTANIMNSCSVETRVGKLTSGLQWLVAIGIGLHYYVTVFHPAVASKPPHTNWKFYAIYSAAFLILCLFARIRWVKKQYVSAEDNITNKKS